MTVVPVVVSKYKADCDGRIFDKPEDCEHHEKMVAGIRKTCPSCDGSGKGDPYGDGRVSVPCGTCNGKGWVEKKEVWS